MAQRRGRPLARPEKCELETSSWSRGQCHGSALPEGCSACEACFREAASAGGDWGRIAIFVRPFIVPPRRACPSPSLPPGTHVTYALDAVCTIVSPVAARSDWGHAAASAARAARVDDHFFHVHVRMCAHMYNT